MKEYIERCDINKIACSHNDKVDASTSGNPHLRRHLFHIFLLAGSQEKYEKSLLRLVFPSDSSI